jgi:hypothetical protein
VSEKSGSGALAGDAEGGEGDEEFAGCSMRAVLPCSSGSTEVNSQTLL